MYCALVSYIVFEGPEEERNMNTLVEMINSMEVREDDETFKNAVDYMFMPYFCAGWISRGTV